LKKKYFDFLCGALKLNPKRDVVSFVGGGGKTSAMIRMANELSGHKKKVLLTTTTQVEEIDFKLIRIHRELTTEIVKKIECLIDGNPVFCAKRRVRGDKIKGIHPRLVSQINREIKFDYMLVESDSAEKKSLKAHSSYEPRIPLCTTLFVPVIGVDIIGKRINIDNVHRPRMVCRVLRKKLDSVIEPADLVNILKNPGGLLKGRPPATRTTVILNKVDGDSMDIATDIAKNMLKSVPDVESVLCGELHTPQQLSLFV